MVNYSAGIIYKICCNNTEITDCYIGSTCSFKARKCQHKNNCERIDSRKYNYNVYQFIRSNGGWDNWSMIQLEAYEATDKRNLETRERYYIDLLKPSLNKRVPTRTNQEYYIENKVELDKKSKIYRDLNAETNNERSRKYRIENKSSISEKKKIYATLNKVELAEKNKIYRDENKIELAEKSKIYRDENKDKIQIYRNENKVDIKIYQTKYDLDNRDAKNEKTRIRYHLKFYNKLENFILS
jgi:hypothetical protein